MSRRIGIVFAALALFAFGVAMGRGTVTTQLGTPLPSATVPVTATSVEPTQATPPSTSLATSSAPATDDSEIASDPDDAPETMMTVPVWPTVPGACGRAVPKPIVEGTSLLTETVDMSVITGGHPSRVDLATSTVGNSLVTADDSHYIMATAADSDSVVTVAVSCNGIGPWLVTRVAGDGTTIELPLPNPQVRPQLIVGGNHVWVSLPPLGGSRSGPVELITMDNPRDSITLPQGLAPLAGHGNTIVGYYIASGQKVDDDVKEGLFAVIDADTGEVLTRFGDQEQLIDGTINAVVDGDYLITSPWECDNTCTLHRYNLADGAGRSVELNPVTYRAPSLAGAAISPDGMTAAVALDNQPPSPFSFEPMPEAGTPRGSTQRIGLIDLDDGSVRALPGVTLGPLGSPALTFSPDGRWLLAAIGEGHATRLLVYDADGHGPFDIGVTIPGPTQWPTMAPAPAH